MSISFFLILFLLCVSFQACHPMSLHFADNNFQKKLQVPIKDRLAKMVLSCDKQPAAECMKLASSKQAENRETVKSKRPKYKRRRKHLKRVEDTRKVSWPVPADDDHKKVKENNGVFNSDYEHARTHPPSHN